MLIDCVNFLGEILIILYQYAIKRVIFISACILHNKMHTMSMILCEDIIVYILRSTFS